MSAKKASTARASDSDEKLLVRSQSAIRDDKAKSARHARLEGRGGDAAEQHRAPELLLELRPGLLDKEPDETAGRRVCREALHAYNWSSSEESVEEDPK